MIGLERKIMNLVLVAAASSCAQAPSAEEDKDMVNYVKFDIHVAKTATHDTYDVQNGIIIPTPDNKGGVIKSTLKFCDQNNWVEVPIADTDYREKDKAITPKEERGEIPSSPFYRASLRKNSCELILSNGTIIKAEALKK